MLYLGVQEQAVIDMPGIRGCWTLRRQQRDREDSVLAVSFVGVTAFLQLNGEALEGVVLPMASTQFSFYCGNVEDDLVPFLITDIIEGSTDIIWYQHVLCCATILN